MNSLSVDAPMKPDARSEAELQALRELCDQDVSRMPQRLKLLKSFEGRQFQDSEHQVVFESICFLFRHGGVSAGRLAVHLNNRGFPDVDLDKYFPSRPRVRQ
jgi:hypothetical protein